MTRPAHPCFRPASPCFRPAHPRFRSSPVPPARFLPSAPFGHSLQPHPARLHLSPPGAACHLRFPRSSVRSPPLRETPHPLGSPACTLPHPASPCHPALSRPSLPPSFPRFLRCLGSPSPSPKLLRLPWVRRFLGGTQADLGRVGFGSRPGLLSAVWPWTLLCGLSSQSYQEGSAFSWKLVSLLRAESSAVM